MVVPTIAVIDYPCARRNNCHVLSTLQVFLDNLGIGLMITFIVLVSVLVVTLKIIFFDPPIM
jgi:hypothetical protein